MHFLVLEPSVYFCQISHEFFRESNKEGKAFRTQCALDALHDACNWLESGGGEIAVSIRSLRVFCISLYAISVKYGNFTKTT